MLFVNCFGLQKVASDANKILLKCISSISSLQKHDSNKYFSHNYRLEFQQWRPLSAYTYCHLIPSVPRAGFAVTGSFLPQERLLKLKFASVIKNLPPEIANAVLIS